MSVQWRETLTGLNRNRYPVAGSEQDTLVWECVKPDRVEIEQRTIGLLVVALLAARTLLQLLGM